MNLGFGSGPEPIIPPIGPPPPGDDKEPQQYRVRIQAQGGGLDKKNFPSYAYAKPMPMTVAEGIAALQILKSQIPKKQLPKWNDLLRRAERYITSGPGSGGLYPPGASFQERGVSDRRVDVEIQRGGNFLY